MGDPGKNHKPDSTGSKALPDASVVPDFDDIERSWNAFLAEDEAGASGIAPAARAYLGLGTPSSFVGSAEGMAQFEGLRINGNGRLDDVHTALLRRKIGEFDFNKMKPSKPADKD
jgi:hypothetical protein